MLSIAVPEYEISHRVLHENSHLQEYEATHINAGMNIKLRMVAARDYAGLTQKELAEKVYQLSGRKLDQAVISNLERGKAASSKRLPDIARACGVRTDWLTLGEGEMLPDNMLREPNAEYGVSPGPNIAQGQIPIISYVRAGDFCEAEDPFEPGDADEWLPFRPPGAGPRTYALKVEGESNDPRIRDGEVVIVDPDRAPDPGKYVVAKRHSDSKVTLKQLSVAEGEYFLKPGNPNWPEPIIKVSGDWSICGVVVGKYDPM
ncbi:helix-turn-helix domain-containing protein [Alcanivorax sp.]|uniref:helix-turn-helix domain-containing protein n=1 Tax=Alcanivorax sp. TaxID=1872427 RepID=UPI003A9203A2